MALYSWARPLDRAPFVDHTWVTSYTPSTGPEGGHYWFCWGEQHDLTNLIGQHDGDAAVAGKLVKPDQSHPPYPGTTGHPEDGSITFYAIDGVCHQLANQVLFATGGEATEPMRVQPARGYHVSTFFYGDYGLNTEGWNASRLAYAPHVATPGDDFEAWLEGQVKDPQRTEVRGVRTTAHEALTALRAQVPHLSVDEVYGAFGVIALTAFAGLYQILHADGFARLFPSLPGVPETLAEATAWIDEDQFERCCRSHRLT